MRKAFFFAGILVVIGFGVWFAITSGNQKWVDYADGSRARLIEATGGSHQPPPVLGKPWSTLASKLPAKGPIDRFRQWLGGTPNGESRSWTHVPDDSSGLHIWFENRGAPVPLNPEELAAGIADAEGWSWMNYGWANTKTATLGKPVDLIGFDFAAFPRWQKSIGIEVSRTRWSNGETVALPLGRHVIDNPVYLAAPLTNWSVGSLPQSVTNGSLVVTLESIHLRKAWRDGRQGSFSGEAPPSLDLKLSSIERQGEVTQTNIWSEVLKSVFDNYGNNSHQTLPPRRPGDHDVPAIQWRIAVELAGEAGSIMASNAFAAVPARAFPAPGSGNHFAMTQIEAGGLSISEVTVYGAGEALYRNNVLFTNAPPGPTFGKSLSSSPRWSGGGNQTTRSMQFTSGSPFVVARLDGRFDKIRLTCRAMNEETGEVRWLRTYGEPSKQIHYERVFNDAGVFGFSCQQLDTNANWSFTVGIHQPVEVEFYIDRPEYAAAE